MPLPNPDYLSTEFIHWNSSTHDAVLVATVGTTKRLIYWNPLDNIGRLRLHTLVMAYVAKNSLTEATALTVVNSPGWQVVNFMGTVVGANPTGLANNATVYTATIIVDGTPVAVAVTGSMAQTFTDLINEINVDLGGTATASIVNGNIEVTSSTTGSTSTVDTDDESLFRNCNGFKVLDIPFNGAADIDEVFQFNLFAQQPIGENFDIQDIPRRPPRKTNDKSDVYFDHFDMMWKHTFDDSPA